MPRIVVKIEGLDEVRKGCRNVDQQLGEKVATGAFKNIHVETAKKVIGWAIPAMPSVSGKFIGSWKSAKQAKGAVVRSTLVYAGVTEFGGRIPNRGSKGAGAQAAKSKHARGSRGTHQHKPPKRPSYYIYPAAREHMDDIVQFYEHEIQQLLDREFGR